MVVDERPDVGAGGLQGPLGHDVLAGMRVALGGRVNIEMSADDAKSQAGNYIIVSMIYGTRYGDSRPRRRR